MDFLESEKLLTLIKLPTTVSLLAPLPVRLAKIICLTPPFPVRLPSTNDCLAPPIPVRLLTTDPLSPLDYQRQSDPPPTTVKLPTVDYERLSVSHR